MFDLNGSLKTHVVLATYEALQGNGAVFRRVPRWDCLVVDEGQRLKGGKASQLYSVINTLRIAHRVILSGKYFRQSALSARTQLADSNRLGTISRHAA